ncbi:MAG: ATP-dependent Clp protease proteolytic subunit [Candidatus Karelsulcia muelleri]
MKIKKILKEELNKIISEHTNKPFEKVQKDSDRDYFIFSFWMTSEEAKNSVIVDEIFFLNFFQINSFLFIFYILIFSY